MDAEGLRKLIKSESENIELKPSLSQMREIVESAAAFAGAKGGKMIVGVDGNGEILGVQMGKNTIETLTNKIRDNTDPVIYPSISVVEEKGRNVIVIEVKESHRKPVLAFNRPFKRVGKSTVRMKRDEYERTILEEHRDKLRFDSEVCKEATLEDIDWDFVKGFFILEYESLSKKKISATAKNLLEGMNCIKNGKLTNGGILLFGKNPQKFFMKAYIALARYRGDRVWVDKLDYREFNGNLFQQVDKCVEYIEERSLKMSTQYPDRVQRVDIPEYPPFSIREIITIAVVHRDYWIGGSKIIVKMFSDRIEFDSPGGFEGGVNERNILEKQYSRNEVLTSVFNRVQYIEELGEGWDKIIDEHKKHPLKPKLPIVKDVDGTIIVTLFSTRKKFEKLEKKEGVRVTELNERQKKALEFIKERGKITNREYRQLTGISHEGVKKDLKILIKKNLITRRGKGRSTFYILKVAD